MDIEGVENKVLKLTKKKDWTKFDAFVEVGSRKNSLEIFNYFKKIKVNIFSHKIGWKRVGKLNEMPISYKEGLIFISLKKYVPFFKNFI